MCQDGSGGGTTLVVRRDMFGGGECRIDRSDVAKSHSMSDSDVTTI